MVSDFGTTRYCKKCGYEIVRKGDCVTMSADSKFCNCDKEKKIKDEYIDHYGIDSLPQLRTASENNCEVFLTTNKSLLEDREVLQELFNIKILFPKEALEEFENEE